MAIPDPLAVLCALLDRSIMQIAEATTDARVFDRELIVRVADVWDSNTFPIFRAAVGANDQEPEERALTTLLWMAELRREWMVEQAAVAGYALDGELPPSPLGGPTRDYVGTVRPWSQTISNDSVQEIVTDYDLAAAQVIRFDAERAGRRLNARVGLIAQRRFATDTQSPARIDLQLRDVTGFEFAATDLHGASVTMTDDGPRISLGAQGFAHAITGRIGIDDPAWHMSAAGRRADADVPPRTERKEHPSLEASLSPLAEAAAQRLHHTMLGIRSMRYASIVDLAAVSEHCELYAGAGTVLLEAARQPKKRKRRTVLRQLTAPGLPLLDIRSNVILASRPAEPAAELRMVIYTAPHEQYGHPVEESLLRHYAVPRGDSQLGNAWQISVLRDPEPSAFTARTEDFRANH